MPTYYQNLINNIEKPLYLPADQADEELARLRQENNALRMKVWEQGSSIRSLLIANGELWDIIKRKAIGE